MKRVTSRYWIIHDGKTICDVSEAVLSLFRCEAADLLGRGIFEIIPSPEMAQLARLRIKHIIEKGDLHDQDLPIQRPDGTTFWVRVVTHRLVAGTDLFVSDLQYKGEHNPDWHNT